jgi:hypothetical protein
MPKRITIAPHLSVEELQSSFRQVKMPTCPHHYQIIWLLANGKTTAEVIAITGYSRGWIYELVWGYNHLEPESIGDQRVTNRDRDPLLNDVEQAQLWQVLEQPPLDGGLWNGRKVADWMSELKGYKVSRLHRMGIFEVHEVSIESSSPTTPGIRSPQNLQEWKKKSAPIRQEHQEAEPFKEVEV